MNELRLHKKKLKSPIEMDLAMHLNDKRMSVTLYDFVKLSLYNTSGEYCAKTVWEVVATNLCCPILFGLPFLTHNNIVIDHAA